MEFFIKIMDHKVGCLELKNQFCGKYEMEKLNQQEHFGFGTTEDYFEPIRFFFLS